MALWHRYLCEIVSEMLGILGGMHLRADCGRSTLGGGVEKGFSLSLAADGMFLFLINWASL